jgi:hypothetical protein
VDYGELLKSYETAQEAIRCLDNWIGPTITNFREDRTRREDYAGRLRLTAELRGLTWGDPMAENETFTYKMQTYR